MVEVLGWSWEEEGMLALGAIGELRSVDFSLRTDLITIFKLT